MGKRWLVMLLICALMTVVFVSGYKYLSKTKEAQEALGPEKAKVYKENRINLFSITSPGGGIFFAVGEKGTFLTSHDGGNTWQVSGPLVTGENLSSIYFKDEKEGWIVGSSGVLLHTIDGGGKWDAQDLRTNKLLKKIFFRDKNHGVIIGSESLYYYTTDGGIIWNKGLSKITDETYCDPFALEMFNDICFVGDNKETGWIVGEIGIVLKTEDGGATWFEQKLPTDVNLNSVAALDKNHVFVGGQQGVLYSSDDGGNTWKHLEIFVGADIEPLKKQIFRIKMLPFGEGGYPLSDTRAWHVYILGDGIALNSYDYGLNWRQITMNQELEYRWLYDLYYSGGQRACMVGKDGIIFKTIDKGLLWERSYY
jgi:photosystem II stability/assembly factor-like uncharacterized protein